MTHSIVDDWLAALQARHLADLRIPEVTRALRALSSAYVERRNRISRGGALDSAGKRAAFAVFYAPLHFLATDLVVRALGAATPPPRSILDIGCGTGAAGAAWALAAGRVRITGIDRHPWAVDEARWTYRHFGLAGSARHGDLVRLPPVREGTAILAAYVLNESSNEARQTIEDRLMDAAARGAQLLVLEPIARSLTPWWSATARRVAALGGRDDEWRFPIELPPFLRLLDKGAGLDHRELTLKSLYCPGSTG
jgi:SAM-dependent methyltransferase